MTSVRQILTPLLRTTGLLAALMICACWGAVSPALGLQQAASSRSATRSIPAALGFKAALLAVANGVDRSISTFSTAAPPSVSIASPASGQKFNLNQSVPTRFACSPAPSGPGIQLCEDSNGYSGTGGALNTSEPGAYTYTVMAESADGQIATASIRYTVIGPPSVSIASPASGQKFNLNQSVPTRFACSPAPSGPGIQLCEDSNGYSGTAGALNTSEPGAYTYTVMAESADGQIATASIRYTVIGPPSVSIASPASGQKFNLNQSVPTRFACSPAPSGPGIQLCEDSNGYSGTAGALNTSEPGAYTYTVMAESADGQIATASIRYTVIGPPSVSIASPASGQKFNLNQSVPTRFVCSPAPSGPGIQLCEDSNGYSGTAGALNTSEPGAYTYTVMAESADGQIATASIRYTVIGPPANVKPPTISGTTADGQSLTVAPGSWQSPEALTYSYRWQRCDSSGANCVNIPGAANRSYALSSADVGDRLAVVVTATDQNGQSTPAAATPTGPIAKPPAPSNLTLPAISGTTADGQSLTAAPGTWQSPDPLSVGYQWQRCTASAGNCASIAGATGRSYRLTSVDLGDRVALVVTATDQEGQSTEAAATPTGPIAKPPAPSNLTLPAISGTTDAGQYLIAAAGTWRSPDPLTYGYQWQRCDSSGANCVNIGGGAASMYLLPAADVGQQVTVVVSATDREGQTTEATATPVGAPGIGQADPHPKLPPTPFSLGFNESVGVSSYPLQAEVGAPIRRMLVGWNVVEPSPGTWNWSQVDKTYAGLLAAHLRPLIVALAPPCWTHPSLPCTGAGTGVTPPDPSYDGDWSQFILRLAARYPAAAGIEVWNEENLTGAYLPSPNPARYTQLLQQAYRAVKSINPVMPVIAGGLFVSATSGPGGIGDAQFLHAMYLAGAKGYMDGIAIHIYPTAGTTTGDVNQMEHDLNALRTVRDDAGDRSTPIWITELGESTATVSQSQQAADLAAVIQAAKTDGDIQAVLIDRLIDLPGTDSGYGIFNSNGTPKTAACTLSSLVASLLHVSVVGTLSCLPS